MKARFFTIAIGLSLLSGELLASELDGAYERVSLINTRTGESPEAANRVGLLLIAHGHYSMMTMNPERRVLSRDAANALAPPEKLEYLEEWLDVNAHSGRIELNDTTLTWHRQISEDPREVGTTTQLGWRIDKDTLVLSFTLPNGDRYDWTWRRI
jgi:L-ascorbate metabolism protein UlaG (beta-lactamase superfamily)